MMTIKCKVERLLTDVRARAQEHYEQEYRQNQWMRDHESENFSGNNYLARHQARVKEKQEKAILMISASETSPTALHDSDLLRVLYSSPHCNMDKYRNSQFFLFRDSIYAATGPYTESECILLVAELADKERKLFEAMSKNQDSPEVREAIADRRRIPEKVRIAVWRRDQGQCARCSSRLRLEYDHIIPVAEGGSNTVRNIELLCEKCNRSKGKKIQ